MSMHFVSKNGLHIVEVNSAVAPGNRLPNCPVCKDKELGVLNADVIMCYSCSTYFYYRPITTLQPVGEEVGS